MKVLLLLLLVLFTADVSAGSSRRTARQVECDRQTMGAVYRSQGYAGEVQWKLRAEMVGEEPKDAMHIRDDGETLEQKTRWEAALLLGWHDQDDYMAEHEGVALEQAEYFSACLASEKT